ncbi:MAG: HsdM family class I SAM-dependent methyltransferase [Candidatus Thorarchaeota archaeon]
MEDIAAGFEETPSSVRGILDGFEKAGCTYSGRVWSEDFLDVEVFSVPQVKEHLGRVFPTEPSEDGLRAFVIESDQWDTKTWRNHFIRYFSGAVHPVILAFVPHQKDITETLRAFSLTIVLSEGPCDISIVSHSNPTFRAARVWTAVVTANFSEELSEFEATVAAASHKTKVTDILAGIKSKDNEGVFQTFDSLGLKSFSEGVYEPRLGSPLRDAVLLIDVERSSRKIKVNERKTASMKYYEKKGDRPDWIIVLSSDAVDYYSNPHEKIVRYNLLKSDNEIQIQIVTALVAVVDRHSSFNAETFAHQFGKFSPLYATSIAALDEYFSKNPELVDVAFREWKRLFERVYRKGDTDKDLFIRHSYLSLLIRITLMVKYLPADIVKKEALDEVISFFESHGVSLFINDFFHWATTIPQARAHLFFTLREATFEADDIFRTIYQQMVSPETRRALGEFYTPPELASMMVEDSYEIGQTVLDPACGSGTFLVEIVKRVLESSKSNGKKIEFLKKIYGFDVNPIAVSVTKANLLLHLSHLFDEIKDLPIQVFLCDSLYPVTWEPLENLELGEAVVFDMHSIDRKFVFSAKFFHPDNRPSFTQALMRLTELISDSHDIKQTREALLQLFNESQYAWIWSEEGHLEVDRKFPPLVKNFLNFSEMMIELSVNHQNHIWVYLLFNSLGAEEVMNVVDLCIGNPPWLVLNRVYSKGYRNRMKMLARQLQISPEAKNITQLEVSALFLYRCRDLYVKDGGKVFFVVSNAFLTGSNHARTRQFLKLDELVAWKFDRDIFKIHNICLKASKSQDLHKRAEDVRITAQTFSVTGDSDNPDIAPSSRETLIPYEVERKYNPDRVFVRKMLTEQAIAMLLPRGESYYGLRVRNGATIYPQNLFFVHAKKESES